MFLNNYVYKIEYFACTKLKREKVEGSLVYLEPCTSEIFNFIYIILFKTDNMMYFQKDRATGHTTND